MALMRDVDEIRGLKDLFVAALRGSTTAVQEMHHSIARLPFGALESVPMTQLPAVVVRAIHDGIAVGVYGGVRGLAGLAGGAAELTLTPLAQAQPEEREPASEAWEHAIGALNGIVGDRLEREQNGLRMRMEFRHAGRRLGGQCTWRCAAGGIQAVRRGGDLQVALEAVFRVRLGSGH